MKQSNGSIKNNNNQQALYSKTIADRIIKGIINGKYPVESKLPTEREMSKTFAVTRHVIREALKIVQTYNLVSIQQGSGALVNNYKTSCGIELLSYLFEEDDNTIKVDMYMQLVEYHESLAIATVKLAAQNITDGELRHIETLVKRRGECTNSYEKGELALELSMALLYAAKNTCIQLTFNTVLRVSDTFLPIAKLTFPSPIKVQSFFERLVELLRERDHEMATLLITRLFREIKAYIQENESEYFAMLNEL